MSGLLQRGVAVAGNGDRLCALLVRIAEGGYRERGASTGGDSDDDIVPVRFFFRNFTFAEFAGIFVRFCRGSQSCETARDYELNGFGIGVEGGRKLSGVECRNPAAGAGAHIDKPSTAP